MADNKAEKDTPIRKPEEVDDCWGPPKAANPERAANPAPQAPPQA